MPAVDVCSSGFSMGGEIRLVVDGGGNADVIVGDGNRKLVGDWSATDLPMSGWVWGEIDGGGNGRFSPGGWVNWEHVGGN